ncbi:MAG: P1 family peptidase [Eubacteriales bacterium]
MEIDIRNIEGFKIGNAEDEKAATGCTVIIAKNGATAGVATYGGAPASRETELLRSEKTVQKIHAVMLCGGSAYGLDAASGAMKYLEENNIGFNVGKGVVPIVCAASIFDLNVGSFQIRPNKAMGYEACLNSKNKNLNQGNYGAGTGASVGKYLGEAQSMKTGLGFYAEEFDGVKIGAIVALNALGDVYSDECGTKIAGILKKDKNEFLNTEDIMLKNISKGKNVFENADANPNLNANTNTTIACILTNAIITKPEANRIAALAHDAYARSIRPVHTAFDGDTIFAMACGKVNADAEIVAVAASKVLEKAITNAVINAKPAYGLRAYCDMR